MTKIETEFIIEKIKKTTSSIQHEFYQHWMNQNYSKDYYEEYPGYTDDWLKFRIKDLYYLILSYFEAKNLNNSYETFQREFEDKIKNELDLLDEALYHPESETELKIINDFYIHLNPYNDFSTKKRIEDELLKVHSILSNTNHILKKMKVSDIQREEQVYNTVKWIIGLYFPKVRKKNQASFIQKFKYYKPDILIPELKTAIEYKYIKSEKENDIEKYIDEIKTDSINYIGDERYDNFIAAVYLKSNELTTPQEIEACWESKDFPKNWKLIISSN
ncbi:hypothetical protein [Christiangramia forsetii]|uniref:Uncharacterized protein n=2 Tax=Christiangramia forsetii TaxID=411153 RepID=A0LZP3_CHRFK|nr:hypothetical protein [Christiangramia forsetii]GGG46370.1 hypothetical protein GCM10011532_32830 [Christiangramia forsetii]CAL65838.1 hypothetical protein GFO_0864 [Christiangramia forsetii KT0803]